MDFYKVVITSKAQSDISACIRFVLNVSKESALKLSNHIYDSLNTLKTFPERNGVFDMPKSFPFVIRKHIINKRYIALYTIENSSVVIYRVLDSRRSFDYLLQ